MPRMTATTTPVSQAELLDFLRPRQRMILITNRRDGAPHDTPVSSGGLSRYLLNRGATPWRLRSGSWLLPLRVSVRSSFSAPLSGLIASAAAAFPYSPQ